MSVEHVANLIVGSGFGAAPVALRLAEAGEEVVVLERGKAYAPGDFPRSPRDFGQAFWDPSRGRHGLFDLWSFDKLDALVASGLGGGSLIYANVLLRKDEAWFVDIDEHGRERAWPFDRSDLDPFYDQVEAVLAPETLPNRASSEHALAKTAAFHEAARAKSLQPQMTPVAVRFRERNGSPAIGSELPMPSYGNVHGVDVRRRTCRLCGECDIGCNEGAKNSLDHTYLSAAKHAGADLRVGHEVRTIARRAGGGFTVSYVVHDPEAIVLHEQTITCDRLVLGAGSIGSSRLLLKNRTHLLGLSAALGSRMCGNGDLLGFMLRARNADGTQRVIDGDRGPVITSHIQIDDGPHRGAYIQDAGYPAFLSWLTAVTQVRGMARRMRVRPGRSTNGGRNVATVLGRTTTNGSSMPLLGMGRDRADGAYTYANGELGCTWKRDRSAAHFRTLRRTMMELSDALDADFKLNPSWFLRRVMTVHPLGGCPAGETPQTSVVDPWGQAHGVDGLWVTDGAAMPGPVGANPSLTIAAFAERAAQRMLT